MNHDEVLRTNRRVYDAMASAADPLCRAAKDDQLSNPLASVDPNGWLGPSITGARVLCLAAGGGRQSALYAAAGAEVTVVDLSGAMLELDRRVAAERGYRIRMIETSMEDLSMLAQAEFDIVIQPVSSCYIPKIAVLFQQVARVLRVDGLYVSQHKQPTSLQSSVATDAQGTYRVLHSYYRDSPVPPPESPSASGRRLRESGAIEYLHRWEQIVGGMCRAGFMIADLVEPVHANKEATIGSFPHRARYIAPYVRIKAVRKNFRNQATPTPRGGELWLPPESIS